MNLNAFRNNLIAYEGYRNEPYKDTEGFITIGVGRNLDSTGLSDEEVDFLLTNDIKRTVGDCRRLSYWDDLSDTRQLVIADLVFNLGLPQWDQFVKTNAAIINQDWPEAARELLDSKYAKQVGRRARKNAFALEHDRYPTRYELEAVKLPKRGFWKWMS